LHSFCQAPPARFIGAAEDIPHRLGQFVRGSDEERSKIESQVVEGDPAEAYQRIELEKHLLIA
jgi:hypothetical protein